MSEIKPSWIIDQVKKRQRDEVSICLKIHVNRDNVNIVLACGDCPSGRGGKVLNEDEKNIVKVWEKLGCSGVPINPGKIIAFINRIE
ncbi:hypothetical protein [Hahella ganghwensis]|uniref:hypothetical protein n=1 Tax=Hahella ganghwensis TaxID=286420 RepID=UPI00037F1CDF|nr:hypothetical protein [Hahella ganghwensis]